jgi:hypothetical protein
MLSGQHIDFSFSRKSFCKRSLLKAFSELLLTRREFGVKYHGTATFSFKELSFNDFSGSNVGLGVDFVRRTNSPTNSRPQS